MTTDTAHTLIALCAVALLAGGATLSWGGGYGLLVVGGVLLAGVIYARVKRD